MGDVKDILGLNRGPSEGAPQKKEKPKEPQRPKGLSREAFSLLYGQHPIAPSRLLNEVCKKEEPKSASTTQVSFQFIPFKHDARQDELRLYHWVQCYKDANGQTRPADDGPYSFAKYNIKVNSYKYDDIEYETVIRSHLPESETGWTKEETDYLLDMCELLDLRFILIADRWDFPGGPKRTVEDLKEHYYAIAYELAVTRAGDRALAHSNPIVRQPFDAQKERERKEFLQLSLNRSQQQAEEEDVIIAQAEAILQKRKEQAAARRPQGAPLSHPSSFSNSVAELPFFDHNVMPYAPQKPGVYSRRAMLEDAAKRATQQVQPVPKSQKMLESVMTETAGAAMAPTMPTRAVGGMYLALHSEALQLVDLKLKATRPVIRQDEGRGKRSIKVKAQRFEEEQPGGPVPKRVRSVKTQRMGWSRLNTLAKCNASLKVTRSLEAQNIRS